MANPCYTYNGKSYTYEELIALLHGGELENLIADKTIDVKELKGELPKGGKQDAVQIEKPSPGVLRKEEPKVGLSQVGKGNGGNKKPPGKGKTTAEEEIPKSVNPVVDAKQKAAHGIKTKTLGEKIKQWGQEISETIHHFKYVRESEYPSVYNKLRLVEAVTDAVRKMAYEKIAETLKPIAKNKILFEAFERNVVMQDLARDIDKTELFKEKELPWEYGVKDGVFDRERGMEEIRQDAKNMQDYVDRNPLLKKVVEDRKEMMDKVRDALIENKLLKADTKENENYFHHQVLAYMADRSGLGVSSSDVRLHKKGWQRSRTGSMKDYNTNYLESEYEVLTQSLEQIEIKSLLNRIGAEIDVKPTLETLAKESGGKWQDYIPKDYTAWHPKSGTNAFKAASPTEKAAQRIVENIATPEDMKVIEELIAESEKTTWIIPKKIAAQLDEMKVPTKEHILSRTQRNITSSLKQWMLLNPYRVIKYNLNNTSGDLDITLSYDPRMLLPKYAHNAAKELVANFKGKRMSQDIKESLEQGLITSGLSIQEIPNINKEGVFKSLTGHDNLIMKYWNSVKDYTQLRENLLRVTAYKYFKEKVELGKNVYGASDAKAIDALRKNYNEAKTNGDIKGAEVIKQEIAGKLARELIGDYGNLSQGGQWMRQHVYPFWSWVEINSPRYYRLLKNVKYEGGSTAETGARMAGVGAKKIVTGVGKLYAKVMILGGLVTLWNRVFFKDEDEEMRKTNNRQLRLIVGRREDGSIMTVRVTGAFADMLAFVGAEDIAQDIKDVQKGKATIGKKTKEAGSAFVNKMVQGVMPIEKTAAEMVLGKSFYPNVFKPTSIRDRAEHGLRMLSMDKIYRYLTKKPLRGAKELTGLIIYDTDPGEAAYYAMKQRVSDFLDEKDIDRSFSDPTKKLNALYYYKQSLKLKDEKLAKYWHEKYLELGGSDKGEELSFRKGEVLSPLGKKHKDAWLSTLDKEDKEVLKMADDWYNKTYKLARKTTAKPAKDHVGGLHK